MTEMERIIEMKRILVLKDIRFLAFLFILLLKICNFEACTFARKLGILLDFHNLL